MSAASHFNVTIHCDNGNTSTYFCGNCCVHCSPLSSHLKAALKEQTRRENYAILIEIIMTPEEFGKQKQHVLRGVDQSRKGSIDVPIKELVHFINSQDDYVTTSSCSGRAILYCEDNTSAVRKKGCKWLYTSHEHVEEDELISKTDPKEGNIILKYEPLILHVQCRTLESAKLMHTCALECGFRNSGLTLGKKGKIILAVRSCIGLEVPVTDDGNLLVSENYLKVLAKKANEKAEENRVRTEKLFHNLQRVLTAQSVVLPEGDNADANSD